MYKFGKLEFKKPKDEDPLIRTPLSETFKNIYLLYFIIDKSIHSSVLKINSFLTGLFLVRSIMIILPLENIPATLSNEPLCIIRIKMASITNYKTLK